MGTGLGGMVGDVTAARIGKLSLVVPTVVLWEVADRLADRTITLHPRFDHWCRALDAKAGFQIQPLLWEDVNEARNLPFDDPFDCLIAGAALRLNLPLITKDTGVTESKLVETVW